MVSFHGYWYGGTWQASSVTGSEIVTSTAEATRPGSGRHSNPNFFISCVWMICLYDLSISNNDTSLASCERRLLAAPALPELLVMHVCKSW